MEEKLNEKEKIEATKEPQTTEEKIIEESFEQEKEYQPEIIKISASERLLPRNFIPDEQRDSEYEKQTGRTMPAVLFNFGSEEKIVLPELTAKVFKHAVRKTRERYEKPEDKQKRYDAIQRLILAQVRKGLPSKEQERFDVGKWETRAMTSVKEYERLKQTVFKQIEVQLTQSQKEQDELSVSSRESEEIKREIKDLEVNWGQIIPSPEEIGGVLGVKAPELKTGISFKEERERKPAELTPLQEARLMFGRKKATGEEFTKEEVERMIEVQERMPDYLVHRLAIYDVYFRVKRGELERMPGLILSVASGPYGEARAQSDLINLYEELGQEKPAIVNLDLTHEMLKRGREEYEKKYAEKLLKVTSVTRRMEQPPIFKPEVFDMAECTSSLDYLQDPADVFKTLSNMTEAAKIGGLVRLTSRRKFPDKFYEGLEGLGLKPLTEQSAQLQLPEKMLETLKTLYGEEKTEELNEMLKNGVYYILAQRVSREKDVSKIRTENFKLPTEKQEEREWREIFGTVIKLVNERLGAIEKAVKDGNISEAKNLFYEFGRNGRTEAVENGLADEESLEALSLNQLIKKSGTGIFRIWHQELSEKVF
ncbi:hypothetical protein A2W60_00180 [Candidatus Azambacteria bacterium RIFCSPHIGHO2_02_46_12]|uniref:Methyltransferase type 11 domain-containing protein n=1 Tax=Candidatus Azambacteria bacterium RIFCSPHIGHO2_02_46_12 TaxID=1797295 RepID=A0A1F5BG08_9BACT|nr:MAG: hypothetical protein A2W60_00180 [Candidatus Azambacteria bacterium RIFCSPHIGHO2_02_46_12]